MTSGTRTRRDVIRGLAIAALLAAALPLAVSGVVADGPGPAAAPRDREARRRWALARMDEMALERLRCHERFRTPPEIRECQAEFERRHRAYNEIYIEAARE
jgi:pimeloyl-ACP methyl ester carboxylesterase